MRLIDANEILTRIQKAYVDTDLGTNKRAIAINIGLTKALNIVQDCKKIELKTGKWEIYVISMLDGEGCRCSECGFEGVPYWDYCPNCGADMRGDADE